MSNIIVSADNLSKQYMKHTAVNNACFQIEEGMICGLIGPNGAGKTTIMKMLGGLVMPTGGTISLFGQTSEKGLAQARSKTSFIIEIPYLKQKMSARENLEIQRIQKGIANKKRIDEVLELVNLADTGNKIVKNFSLGMRQRLGIANALLAKPELMVLDEPINGLDPQGIVEIRELLMRLNREEHITIIISSHILSELALMCSDFIFVNNGEIIQSMSAAELKKACREYCSIGTDNNALAAKVLDEKLGLTQFEIDKDGTIKLYEKLDDIREISRTFFENGVIPTMLSMNEPNLEEYYLDLVGDENGKHNKVNTLSDAKR